MDHHFRDLYVARRRFIKGRRHNFAFYAALHIRDFFWTLINQQDENITFRMVLLDGMGDVLQKDCFTCARRGNDQGALAFSDGRDNINDAARLVFTRWVFNFHLHALVRIERGEVIKVNLITRLFCCREID